MTCDAILLLPFLALLCKFLVNGLLIELIDAKTQLTDDAFLLCQPWNVLHRPLSELA